VTANCELLGHDERVYVRDAPVWSERHDGHAYGDVGSVAELQRFGFLSADGKPASVLVMVGACSRMFRKTRNRRTGAGSPPTTLSVVDRPLLEREIDETGRGARSPSIVEAAHGNTAARMTDRTEVTHFQTRTQ
jgi:hypothetical protein